ncbi:MAG TPA: BTAD domain-containing putative transcriptional regulator, partial [Gemmatimonadaceae bacterium]
MRLVVLGGLALSIPEGVDDDLAKRRRKLALLAVLAMADRPIGRDTLVDMFWGEEPEDRARHSLSDALSNLRRVLGKDAISARSADIALNPDLHLAVDAREFADACKAREWDIAIALYRGPFLDGVTVDHSPRFDQWLGGQRERLRRQFVAACKARCEELARNREWSRCGDVAEGWLAADIASADGALFLLNARKAPGMPDAIRDALASYDNLSTRLRAELDLPVDRSVAELASSLRDSLRAMGASPQTTAAASPVAPRVSAARRAVPWSRVGVLAAGALVITAAVLGVRASARGTGAARDRVLVAVTSIQNTATDTGAAWLGEGVRQMLASAIDRSAKLEVVPPARVRDAMVRSGAGLGEEPELRVARALGAQWAVRGGITRGDSVYVLDVSITDAASGKTLSTFSVTGQNLIGVADHAVARIRSLASESSGPYFADLETRSDEALQHYVNAQRLGSEGRYTESGHELDAAIALDSDFTSAIMARLRSDRGDPRRPDLKRLAELYERNENRLTQWDRMEQAEHYAYHNGEHERAEQLARAIVERYPNDPRAYAILTELLSSYGKYVAADSVFRRQLALDSLAIASGNGPCVPCMAHSGLVGVRVETGDFDGADRAARRWLELQPALPIAWVEWSTLLSFEGKFDQAVDALRKAVELSGGEPEYTTRIGRVLIQARRYREADSVIAVMSRDPRMLEGALDLRAVLQRERGQHRAALATMEADRRRFGGGGSVDLVRAQEYALLGDPARAARTYESFTHDHRDPPPESPVMAVAGDDARAATWHHGLLADAIWETADTSYLRALADTMRVSGDRSYYGRDWRLYHHVLGLIAVRGQRYEEAMREFSRARWSVAGFSRSLAMYADAALAAHHP